MTRPLPQIDDAVAAGRDRSRFALTLFHRVLERVNVPQRMRECFVLDGNLLRVGESTLPLTPFRRVLLASIGKAAVPMAEHALETLAPRLPVAGVVVGAGPWAPPPGVKFIEGRHPVPQENSFLAAHALLDLMRTADADTLALFLISGGASAMAEAPLDSSIPHEDVIAFYRALLYSGLPIGETNVLRKHLSLIKGGRLALASGEASRCTVLISDVPPGRLDVVGSGPSLPDSSTVADCRALLADTPAFASLPDSIERFFRALPETPKALPEGRVSSVCFTALSSDSLLEAATAIATEAGYHVVIDNTCDDWDYERAAQYLLDRAMEETSGGLPLCLLSAGEVTVSISGPSGQGGRNQQWALAMARLLDGRSGIVALSAGSDGIDGNSPAAGAVVDGATWSRATAAGLRPEEALAGFNTYPVFAALGDAVISGRSDNNLRDLRLIVVAA